MKKNEFFTTREVTMMGLLLAIEIVLSRFCSLSAWNVKIGFSFLPIAVCAVLFGPLQAGIVAALGDFIGAILFPIGAYFPGFTLSAFLTGVVFGLFLHKKQNLGRIFGATIVNQVGLSLLLNTLWISLLYGSPYGPLFVTRIAQSVILGSVQFVALGVMTKTLMRYAGKKAIA